jgi:hypothetical protein
MATALEPTLAPPAPAPPPRLAPDTFATMDEALAHARKAVEIAGGGTPILIREPDGSIRMAGVVKEAAPAPERAPESASDLLSRRKIARVDDQGRVIPLTPEEKAERVKAMAAWLAMAEAEPFDEEQTRRSEQVLKALGVRGYEDVVLDEDMPPNGGA